MWIRALSMLNLRSIERAELDLGEGLNVLLGSNAQGKTSVLEAVGLLARGRSFRTDQLGQLVRRGSAGAQAEAWALGAPAELQLQVAIENGRRRLLVGGREVPPREYHGRLEAVVYSSHRLRVVYGSLRERRQYFDRAAAALWPTYRRQLGDYERLLAQRNAALERGLAGLEAWDERLVESGAELWTRRAGYLQRLQAALEQAFSPGGERYRLGLEPWPPEGGVAAARAWLAQALEDSRPLERRRRRTQVGPHRDAIELYVDGQPAAQWASAGQARSLLLALTEAALRVYREERGTAAVALLDDLDSELDEERSTELCRKLAAGGQALVTTAHVGWGRRLAEHGRVFEVAAGRIRAL